MLNAFYLLLFNKYLLILFNIFENTWFMETKDNMIYTGLLVVVWIIFVGLCINAGGLVVNFIFSLIRPDLLGNLYEKLDLTALYQQNTAWFFGMYSFVLCIAILKVHLFYILVRLMHKIDLSKPFNTFVSNQISAISYYIFSIGIISFIGQQILKSGMRQGYNLKDLRAFWVDAEAFILLSAVVYVIALIFKKGVEIQNENDLTV